MVDVRINLKTNGADQATKEFQRLKREITDLGNSAAADNQRRDFEALGDAIDSDIKSIQGLKVALNDAEKSVGSLFQRYKDESKKAFAETEKAQRSLTTLPTASVPSSKETFDQFGDFSTLGSGFGSGINALGFGGAGSKVADFGDFLGAIEQLKNFDSSVTALKTTLSGVSLATTAAVGGLVLFAGAAILLKKELDDDAKKVREFAKAQRDLIEQEQKTRQDLRTLTADEVRQQIADAEFAVRKQTEARDAFLATQAAAIGNVENTGDAARTLVTGFLTEIGISAGEIGAAKDEAKTYNEAIAEQAAELQRLQAELNKIEFINLFREGTDAFLQFAQQRRDLEVRNADDIKNLDSETLKQRKDTLESQLQAEQSYQQGLANQIASTQRALNEVLASGAGEDDARVIAYRESLTSLTEAQSESITQTSLLQVELRNVNTVLAPNIAARERETAAIEKQTKDLETLTTKRDTAAENIRALQDELAAFDDQRRTKAAADALKARREAEFEALEQQFAGAKRQEQITKINAEAKDREKEINRKFQDTALKNLRDFRQKEQRAIEDANLKRLRLVEDLEADLLDRVAENDVAGFISRLRQGNRDIGRFDQDASIDGRRRGEDFARQNEELIAQRNRDIASNLQATQQKLQIEQQGRNAALTAEQQYQQARLALQQRFAQEDLNLQVAAEEAKRRALIASLEAQFSYFQQANRQISRASLNNNATDFTDQRVAASARGVSPFRVITANATGGIYDRPTLSLLAEVPGMREAAIPFRPSEGLPKAIDRLGLGGGSGVTVVNDLRGADFGSLNEAQLEVKLTAFGEQIADAMGNAMRKVG